MGRKRKKTTTLLAQFDGAESPIYALDRQLAVVYANAACGQWLKITVDELLDLQCGFQAVSDSIDAPLPLAPPPSLWDSAETVCLQMSFGGQAKQVTFHRLRVEGETLAVLAFAADQQAPCEHDPASTPVELHERLFRLRDELKSRNRIAQLLGDSDAMCMVREQTRIASQSTANVLLIGEPGSGRQAVARAIHRSGADGRSSFAQIACPISSAEMLQAAVKAFLRRRAELKEESPGTILLVEVDQLPADAQHELVGFLDLPEVNIRLIGTSRRSLTELVAADEFDRRLAYRLSTISIELPSLRARRADIALLAQYFLEQAASTDSPRHFDGFTDEALERLVGYDWPGNLPQLAAAIDEACGTASESMVTADDLPDFLAHAEEAGKRLDKEPEPIVLDDFLEQIELELVQEALEHAGGNKTQAAKLLGISRARMIRRVKQLGLEPGIDFEEID